MKIADVLEPALTFQLDVPISKLISEMRRRKKEDALVFDGKEYAGMINAQDLARRTIHNPHKAAIGTFRRLIQKVTPFSPEADLRELVETLLINSYTSIPIKHEGGIKTLTKLGLLRLLPKDILKGKSASDIQTFPYCVSTQDSFAVARSIMRQMRVFRLVVVNEKGKADGVLNALDLLRTNVDRKRSSGGEQAYGKVLGPPTPAQGELAGDKVKLGDVLASSISLMQDTFLTVKPDAPLTEVVNQMVTSKNLTAIVEDEKLEGVITPEHILKLLSKEVSGVYVRVTGQQKEDVFMRSVIDEELRHEIQKLGKLIPIDYLTLNVKKFRESGKRVKYSLKAKLVTQKGLFVSQAGAWDITKAMHELMARLEREILKKKGKERVYRRGPVDHFAEIKTERA